MSLAAFTAAPLSRRLSRPAGPATTTLIAGGAAAGLLAAVALGAWGLPQSGLATDLLNRAQAPSLAHPMGTDPLGRDVFTRTVKGLWLSLQIGLIAAAGATAIAVALGLLAATGRWADRIVGGLIDLVLALPHLVLLILIAMALGGGREGVILAVALSHWPGLARLIRAEAKAVLTSDYVAAGRRLSGRPKRAVLAHALPHILPQALIGGLLLFPHAVLHEAALSFLGFGLSPHEPAIGILLAESLQALAGGLWWTGVLPGLALVAMVLAFARVTEAVQLLADPARRTAA